MPEHEESASGAGDVLRRMLIGLGAAIGLLVAVLAVGLGALQTEWGAEQVRRIAVERANETLPLRVELDRLSGTFLTGIRAEGIRVHFEGARVLSVDTLSARYDLWPLLRSRVLVSRLDVAGPHVSARREPSGRWNVARLVEALTDTSASTGSTEPSPWRIDLGGLRLNRGSVTARYAGTDSTLRARDLTLRVSEFRSDSTGFRGRIDRLESRFIGFDSTTAMTTELNARLEPDRFFAEGQLTSERSRIALEARVPLGPASGSDVPAPGDSIVTSVDLRPLALSDIEAFWPGVSARDTVRGSVQVRGTSRALTSGADLTFGHGGTVSLAGRYTESEPDRIHYELDGQIERLNLEAVTGLPELNSSLTLRIGGNFSERADRPLQGEVDLEAAASRWRGRAVETLNASARIEDRTVELDGRLAVARLDAGRSVLEFTGRVDTDRPELTYQAAVQMDQLQLAAFDPSLPDTRLTGTLEADGRGTDPSSARLETQLEMLPLESSGVHLDRLELNAVLDSATVRGQWTARAGPGRMASSFTTRPFEESPEFRLEDGRFTELNLEHVLADTTLRTDLNGTLTLTGHVAANGDLHLDASASLEPSTALGYRIDRAETRTRLDGEELHSSGRLDMAAAAIDWSGSARPFASPLELTESTTRFERMDAGRLLADTTWSSRIRGTLRASGRGTSFEDAVLQADLSVDSSRFNRQTITGGNLAVRLDHRDVRVEGGLALEDGSLRVRGSAAPASPTLRYELEELTFERIDLGPWMNRPDLSTRLTGRIQGTVHDPTSDSIDGLLQVRLDSSSVDEASIDHLAAEARARNGTITWSGDLASAAGGATTNGTVTPFSDPVTYTARGRLREIRPSAWTSTVAEVEGDTEAFSGGFDLEGTGTTPADAQAEFRMWARPSQRGNLQLDTLYAGASVRDGLVRLDTLLARSNAGRIDAGGTVGVPGTDHSHHLQLTANDLSLAPLDELAGASALAGSGTAEARLFGSAAAPRFDVRVELSNLLYDELRVSGFEGRILGARTDSLLVNVRTDWESIALPNFLVENVQTETLVGPTTIGFSSDWTIDDQRSGSLGGRIDRRPERARVRLDSLGMSMGAHSWRLDGPARIGYANAYRIDEFLLYSDDQQIAADGVYDPNGVHDLDLTVDGLQLDPFTDLVGYDGLGGRLSSRFVLTGPATDPRLDGELSVEDLSSTGRAVGRLTTQIEYEDYRMDVQGEISHQDGSTLRLSGHMPVDLTTAAATMEPPLAERSVDIRLRADSLRLNWIDPLLDPASWQNVEGWIAGDVHAGGTLGTPALEGNLSIGEAAASLPDLGIRPQEGRLNAIFRDTLITLTGASARSGNGRVQAEGTVHVENLALGRFDLGVTANNFLAANTRDYRIAADGRLEVSGTTNRPVIGGSTRLTQADFYLTEAMTATALEPVTLSLEDLQTLESRFGIQVSATDTSTYDFYQALSLDTLEISFSRDVWLRSSSSPKMAVEFTGGLTVVKRPFEPEQVFGTIEVAPTRSYVEQFGRRFDITSGTLTFNGPIENPILDLQAAYRVRARRGMSSQANITLGLNGPLDDLDFTLGSEEGLSTAEIASYLAFGRPPGQTFRGGSGGSAENMAVNAAVGQLAGMVENLAASELGLDVIDIQHDPDLGTTLTAGSYLTSDIFASLSFPISVAGNSSSSSSRTRELTLEYSLSDWLLVRLQRQNGILETDLLWEYAY